MWGKKGKISLQFNFHINSTVYLFYIAKTGNFAGFETPPWKIFHRYTLFLNSTL
jgi:hypothetical protein